MTIQPWELLSGDFQDHLNKLCIESQMPGKGEVKTPAFEQESKKGDRVA